MPESLTADDIPLRLTFELFDNRLNQQLTSLPAVKYPEERRTTHEGPLSYENDPCDLTPHADQHQHQDNRNEEETINMDSALNCDRNLLWYDRTRSKGIVFHIVPCLLT